jgi:hypothetical protein
MKRLGLIVGVIANVDALALTILSTTMPIDEQMRPFVIIFGVVCWVMTAYIIYLSVNEKR